MNLQETAQTDVLRAGRLTSQLPPESRLLTALNPAKDWNWDKEVQSRILAKLDQIGCMIANTHKKKGKSPAKPEKQFQPDYVEKAKKAAEKEENDKIKMTEEEAEENRLFWQRRYRKVKMV